MMPAGTDNDLCFTSVNEEKKLLNSSHVFETSVTNDFAKNNKKTWTPKPKPILLHTTQPFTPVDLSSNTVITEVETNINIKIPKSSKRYTIALSLPCLNNNYK